MRSSSVWQAALLALAILTVAPQAATASGLADDGGAEWKVEQPAPPSPTVGVPAAPTPIGLGKIGDIEFYAPNRGALITSGNGSPAVPPGVWYYNGVSWRELSTVCGASDGRIAWAGPDEFWTISDGRAGQALASSTERPPLEDNTLCHFAPGPSGAIEVVGSYGKPPFLSTSYEAMDAAACIAPNDCWFGGGPLREPQIGAFQLHWNGNSVEVEPYLPEGHAVLDLRAFEGRLYESVRLRAADRNAAKTLLRPPPLRLINPPGAEELFEGIFELPLYSAGEFSIALDYLHLGADEDALWAAAGPQLPPPAGSSPAEVTILRKPAGGAWTSVIAPSETGPSSTQPFPGEVVDSIAPEPQSSSAWIALDSEDDAGNPDPLSRALVARVSDEGTVSDALELPDEAEGYGPLGAPRQIVCPAAHDCWLSTDDGWLLHLATAAERASPVVDGDLAFASPEPISARPSDESTPQEPSDVVPVEAGAEEVKASEVLKPPAPSLVKVHVPLLSHMHSRLLHRTTLELSFRLAVKARVRLVAKRHGDVVASTRKETLKAGNRSLLLKLDPARWPTKLALQTHALAPLPTRTTTQSHNNSVATSMAFPRRLLSSPGLLR